MSDDKTPKPEQLDRDAASETSLTKSQALAQRADWLRGIRPEPAMGRRDTLRIFRN